MVWAMQPGLWTTHLSCPCVNAHTHQATVPRRLPFLPLRVPSEGVARCSLVFLCGCQGAPVPPLQRAPCVHALLHCCASWLGRLHMLFVPASGYYGRTSFVCAARAGLFSPGFLRLSWVGEALHVGCH